MAAEQTLKQKREMIVRVATTEPQRRNLLVHIEKNLRQAIQVRANVDAEDILQETVLRLLRESLLDRITFEDDIGCIGFMASMVKHTATDFARKAVRKKRGGGVGCEPLEEIPMYDPPTFETPLDELIRYEDQAAAEALCEDIQRRVRTTSFLSKGANQPRSDSTKITGWLIDAMMDTGKRGAAVRGKNPDKNQRMAICRYRKAIGNLKNDLEMKKTADGILEGPRSNKGWSR